MGVVYILLFIQGITGSMYLYQPQNIVSVDVNGSAVITCLSSEALDSNYKVSWYHRKWRSSDDLLHVKSCGRDNDPHKYVCNHKQGIASLEISNVQTDDSGVYYCVYTYSFLDRKFGNGTNLHVGALGAHNTVHLYWNISGTYHKGRIISKEEPDGTWTVMNIISLHKDNWNHREKVTCEAWITSFPTHVHWEIPDKGELHPSSKCQSYLIALVTAGTLLTLILLLHLMRTMKLTDNETHKDPLTEDAIAYAELNINNLNRLNKLEQ
ncbi:uncharacterized protein RB166_014914 [Leptodactylus fuscus]